MMKTKMEKMPEYPKIVFKGYTEDKKRLVFMVGNARREVGKHDDDAQDNFNYALYRLRRLIKYKREKIAMDSII